MASRSEAARAMGGEAEVAVEWQPWQPRADAESAP